MSRLSKSTRNSTITLIVVLFCAHSIFCQTAKEIAENIFKITADCPWGSGKSKRVSGTGFILKGEKGIITTLHTVCGCSNISVIPQNVGSSEYRNWKISRYDINGDIAFLIPTDDKVWTKIDGRGFEKSSISLTTLKDKNVRVYGFPFSVKSYGIRDELIRVLSQNPVQELKNIIPDGSFEKAVEERGSPSLATKMLNLSAGLRPGHSGAPILSGGKVIGVAIGGFRANKKINDEIIQLEADQYINWGLPIRSIHWQCLSDNPNALDHLAKKRPNQHYSSYMYGHKVEGLTTNAVLKIYKKKGLAFKVFVDGVYLGLSDSTLELPITSGSHDILLANPEKKKFIAKKAFIYPDRVNEFKIRSGFDYESDAFHTTKLVRKENREIGIDAWLAIPINTDRLQPIIGTTVSTSLYRSNTLILSSKILIPRTHYKFSYATQANFPDEQDYFTKIAPYVGLGLRYTIDTKSKLLFYTEGVAALSNDSAINLMSLFQVKCGMRSKLTSIGKWNVNFELGLMNLDFKSKSITYDRLALSTNESFHKSTATSLLINVGIINRL